MILPDNATIAFQSRAATVEDEVFLFRLYAASRADLDVIGLPPEQKDLLVRMQFNAQRQQYSSAFPAAENTIILIDDVPVGRTLIHRDARDYRLIDIVLLPQFRGLGIGTRLIKDLIHDAEAANAVVSLHVRKENVALNLYRRLGFVVNHDDGVYVSMEWRAQSV
jgi:ribosomal protein S18 acetylase RimI-like enzyme